MKYEDRWKRKILIYLYEYFNHNQNLIIDEFCSHKLADAGLTKDLVVNDYLKKNKIKLSDYVTMVDDNFKGDKDPLKPVLVYKKGEEPVEDNEEEDDTQIYSDNVKID